MNKFFLPFCTFLLVSFTLFSQTNSSLSSSEILQALKKLNVTGSVLYVAAHPDDENTRLLAYLANEKKLRTGYLSLTRGDGGQNLVGKEQGEPLGLIRTQELLAARRTDGAEQFFTRANDFGFSKNPDETFSIWNKDSILYDVVLTIRRFKPDVIICRFPTTGEGGHGHHTASAILAVEAFEAAADPQRFPDQLKTTEVWQCKRILWNTFNFGTTNTTAPNQLKIDVGSYNSLLGKSYGEIASESRSMHKSQGFGSARQRGSNIEFFKHLKGDSAKSDLFDNINNSWSRIPNAEKIETSIKKCLSEYSADQPSLLIPQLVEVYKQIQSLSENNSQTSYWKNLKLKETEKLILACAGFWAEALASEYSIVPGAEMTYSLQVVNRSSAEITLNSVRFLGGTDSITSLSLKNNEQYTFKRKEKLSKEVKYTNPYWLDSKHAAGRYEVREHSNIGQPENSPSLKVIFNITVNGLSIPVERKLEYKFTDPVKGELYRPFEVLPPVTLNHVEKVYVFDQLKTKTIFILVKANASAVSGELALNVPTGWQVQIKNPKVNLKLKGDEVFIEATLTPGKEAANGKISAAMTTDGNVFNQSVRRIDYDHIPSQFILSPAEVPVTILDLKKTATNIGYVPGAGDEVAACLKQIGYNVTILNDEVLKHEDLSKYSAIITGIRAYNTNDRLSSHREKLMNYVKSGGNLIVQYNTNSRVGPLQANIGPYPFTISRDRVTDENAKVNFKEPKHKVLTFPNQITETDFQGWIQERGIYYATEIDKNYETVLSMNDPGEKPHEGSLIIGKYGTGNFVYTGLVFFRELPAGVPGAYRLLVNLISLPKNK